MKKKLLPLALSLFATATASTMPLKSGTPMLPATSSTLPISLPRPIPNTIPALDTLRQQLTQGPVTIYLAGQWFVLWKITDRTATVSPSLQAPLKLYPLAEFLQLWSQGGQFSKVLDLRS